VSWCEMRVTLLSSARLPLMTYQCASQGLPLMRRAVPGPHSDGIRIRLSIDRAGRSRRWLPRWYLRSRCAQVHRRPRTHRLLAAFVHATEVDSWHPPSCSWRPVEASGAPRPTPWSHRLNGSLQRWRQVTPFRGHRTGCPVWAALIDTVDDQPRLEHERVRDHRIVVGTGRPLLSSLPVLHQAPRHRHGQDRRSGHAATAI
jgi:hypothetical protein